MQSNPNPNDIVRMQSQQGYPYNVPAAQQYTLPITGALSQPPQAMLQPTQLTQRRPRNMKKVPANPAVIPPINTIPQQITTFQQYLTSKYPQYQYLYKFFSPNFNLPINSNIIKLLNPFFEDPSHINFLKKLPIPCLFEYLPEFEPKVFFSPTNNMIQANQSSYEVILDQTKPNINKVFLVCYYINNKTLQMIKLPNTKLIVTKYGSNASETIDCYQYGESEKSYYYVINATRSQYPIYIKPQSDSLVFIVVPCKQNSSEAIKKAILSNKLNVPTDLSQISVSCPCRHSSYNLDNLIKTVFINGEIKCNFCNRPIIFNNLEIANSDSTEQISINLYYNFQLKYNLNTDLKMVDKFIDMDSDENGNSEDGDDFQLPDYQNSQEYIDSCHLMFP